MESMERFGLNLGDALWASLFHSIQNWLDDHPIWYWLVLHPWFSLGLGFLIIFLLWGLLGAVVRLTQELWIKLLALPIWVGEWILRSLSRLVAQAFQILFKMSWKSDEGATTTERDRVVDILNRLATLQQEQQQLTRELEELLRLNSQGRSPKRLNPVDSVESTQM